MCFCTTLFVTTYWISLLERFRWSAMCSDLGPKSFAFLRLLSRNDACSTVWNQDVLHGIRSLMSCSDRRFKPFFKPLSLAGALLQRLSCTIVTSSRCCCYSDWSLTTACRALSFKIAWVEKEKTRLLVDSFQVTFVIVFVNTWHCSCQLWLMLLEESKVIKERQILRFCHKTKHVCNDSTISETNWDVLQDHTSQASETSVRKSEQKRTAWHTSESSSVPECKCFY